MPIVKSQFEGNLHYADKSEHMGLYEDETNPMNYAKVFTKDRFIINRPKQEPR